MMTADTAPLNAPQKLVQRLWNFSRQLWHDQDFWIRALAIKGGASAVVVAGVIGISYVVALPFFIAAVGIGICGGLIGLGLYGVFLGATTAWQKLKEIYYLTLSTAPPTEAPPAQKPLRQKLEDNAHVQRLLAHPLAQKLLRSRVWKVTRALTQKQQDMFLTGLAGTGSMFWGIISALTLITQIVVLPVVAVGSLLTFGTAFAVGGLFSGVYGVYLSIDSLLRSLRARKK